MKKFFILTIALTGLDTAASFLDARNTAKSKSLAVEIRKVSAGIRAYISAGE
jgi:hypothetical protein